MTFVKLPCRGREARCRYLEMETIRKTFEENIPNTYRRNPFHGQANKYCIFGFPKVNTMQQLFEGEIKGAGWGWNIQGFCLTQPWTLQGKTKVKKLRISQKSKDTLIGQTERGGGGGNALKGAISENSTLFGWPKRGALSGVNDDILSPNGHLRHHKTAAPRA